MQTPAQLCLKYSLDISQFLVDWLKDKKSFECSTTYGEFFALNLLGRHHLLTDELKSKLLNGKSASDMGLFAYEELTGEISSEPTDSTSQVLLSTILKIRKGIDVDKAHLDLKKAIEKRQLKSGFIAENEHSISLQMHCFSSALLYDYFLLTNSEGARKRFLDSVEFIRHFILPNGETFYVGKRQQHSFGVGLLIFILSAAYELNRDSSLIGDLQNVLKYLTKYQLTDGSFPLVFNGIEKNIPASTDLNNPEYCGWFHENNYFDDLPMLGLYLYRASELLNSIDENIDVSTNPQTSYVDDLFNKIVKTRYIAVVSVPGGEWTNGLPFPYLYHKGDTLTPCLGGEEKSPTLFSEEMLSLPITVKKKLPWRKYSKSFLFKNRLIMLSLFGIYIRHFLFREEEILIETKGYCWIDSVDTFSFKASTVKINSKTLQDKKLLAVFSKDFSEVSSGYSVCGKLNIVTVPMNTMIKIKIP